MCCLSLCLYESFLSHIWKRLNQKAYLFRRGKDFGNVQGRALRSRTGCWGKQVAGDFMDLGSGAPRSSCEQPMCRKTPRLKGNAWTSFKLRLNTVGSIKGIIWIPCCLQQGSDVWQGRYIAKLQSNSAGQLWNAGNTEWKTEADWNSYW